MIHTEGEVKMNCKEKYEYWLKNVDEKHAGELKNYSEQEINDAFYTDLQFGTGGLRGIMGTGTNRMNIYTVRRATQGLANEINEAGMSKNGVVIAFDSRNNSKTFAAECANVLCANGIKTYLFDDLRPTPELSFAVRYLKCARGIVITASHNPKEYNGYKVYGEDGGQIPPTTADKIIKYIDKTDVFADVKLCENPDYTIIGAEVDDAYIAAVKKQSLNIAIPDDLKVVYTPLHGSGNKSVRRILNEIGAADVFTVPEQELPDGNFPTVKSPNPENAEALTIGINYAKKSGADLVLGTDPDSDRVGIAVKTADGEYAILNGNQTGMLMCEFILRKMKNDGSLKPEHTVIKTVVTTETISKITESYGIKLCNVLTGFKYIGEKIKEYENGHDNIFLFGLEESYGYLKGTYARDKDAVVASMLIVQTAAYYKSCGKTLYDGLQDIYAKYGKTVQQLKTITLTGEVGAKKISDAMKRLRENIPESLGGFKVTSFKDYLAGADGLPKSNVIKIYTEDGWCAVRPSGTEPKIKFYFETTENADSMYSDLKQMAGL